MKRYFFNEDGTIKVFNMIILISIIFIIGIVFIYNSFFKREVDAVLEPYSTTNRTSSVNMCKDCDFSFNVDNLTFNVESEYKISSYIEVKNMVVNNIKFSDYDNSLISIENSLSGLVIKTKDKVGKTKIVAEYANIVHEVEVVVTKESIKSAKLLDHPYYILNNQSNEIEIETNPKGVDLSELDIRVEDTSVAEVIEGKVVGLSEGKTRIILNFDGVEQYQDLYVFNNVIQVAELNKENKLVDTYKISLSEFKDNIYNIVVNLDDCYNQNDLIITHEDEGFEVYIDYDGKYSLDKSSYKYRITLNGDKGSSIIKFSLGTSVRILEIGE